MTHAIPGGNPVPGGGIEPARFLPAQAAYEEEKKSRLVAWLLWAVGFGFLGAHRYFLGDKLYGFFMTITLGGLGIWYLIDGFFLPRRLRQKNSAIRADVFTRYGLQP